MRRRAIRPATVEAAASEVARILSEGASAGIAESLTCREADAVADLIRLVLGDDPADDFLVAHATGDEDGDAHVGYEPRSVL